VKETLPTAGAAGGEVAVTPVTAETLEGEVWVLGEAVVGLVLGSVGIGLTTVAGEVAVGSVVGVVVGTTPGRADGWNPPTPPPGDMVVLVVLVEVVVEVAAVVLVTPVPPPVVVPVLAVVVVTQSNDSGLLEVWPEALVAINAVPPAPIISTSTAAADLLNIM